MQQASLVENASLSLVESYFVLNLQIKEHTGQNTTKKKFTFWLLTNQIQILLKTTYIIYTVDALGKIQYSPFPFSVASHQAFATGEKWH